MITIASASIQDPVLEATLEVRVAVSSTTHLALNDTGYFVLEFAKSNATGYWGGRRDLEPEAIMLAITPDSMKSLCDLLQSAMQSGNAVVARDKDAPE